MHSISLSKTFLLLCFFLGLNTVASAQGSHDFLLQIPFVDTLGGGNQPAVNQYVWQTADTAYPGMVWGGTQTTDANGILTDSIFVLGPGIGTFILNTIDCHGDTIQTVVPFDSSINNIISPTIYLCARSNAVCQAYITVNQTQGNPTISFTDASTAFGTVTGWNWDFNDGNYSTAQNPTHTYALNGTYSVALTIQTSTGCTSTHVAGVIVTGAGIACSTSLQPAVWGNAILFTVNYTATGYPTQVEWDFGDGAMASTSVNSTLHAYAANGTYPVCAITTFDDGCMDTTCYNLNVTNANPGACTAAFTHSTLGQTVTFTDISTLSSGSPNERWWSFGDGTVDSVTTATVTHTYASSGTYNVRFEIFTTAPCYDDTTDIVNFTQPTCFAGFTHAPDTTGQYSILAFNTSTGTSLTYLWDFGDGNTSTQAYPVHTYSGPGTYQVCLTVNQPSPACTDVFCDSVTVTQKQAMAFTFGVWNPNTGLDANPLQKAAIFPNPATHELNLSSPIAEGDQTVQIFNAQGQCLLVKSGHPTTDGIPLKIDVSTLPQGIYFLKVQGQEKTFLAPFSVQR